MEVFCQSENSSSLTPIVLQNWSGGKDIIEKYAEISKLVHFIVKNNFTGYSVTAKLCKKEPKKLFEGA